MMFISSLARKRSLASASLLFLLVVDEIQGLCFLAVGVLLARPDLFISMQDFLFPATLCVAGTVALVRNWRLPEATVEEAVELVDLDALNERTRAERPAFGTSQVQVTTVHVTVAPATATPMAMARSSVERSPRERTGAIA